MLGIMCIVAAVALTTARQPSRGADAARVEVETAPEARGPVERATATPRLEAVPTVASKPRPKAAASETPAPVSTKKAPTVEPVEAPSPAPVKPLGSAPVTQTAAATKAPLALAPTTAPPGSKTESDDDPDAAPVTITGCLERDESAFWLKKTSGTDAPKSRSWKFGFLKKRSAPIELVDPHDTLRLTNYVGRRIAATGTLVDRELRTRSIRQVKAVCN
ncbi:MAG TPA: hypothetical protein VK886_16690 [Vicinamibacterales bacterium]|nr:hypothetical protein [Vicinamibacterales bacterium]